MALTAKQQLFITEYLVDFNATQAAIRAGYSEKTAGSIGSENLQKPEIEEAIFEALEARSKRVGWSADDIMRDLREMAENRLLEPKDRLKAYELGGKHLGMYKDKVEMTGDNGGAIQVNFNIPRPAKS
ncbi:terminase small subunit [Paenibacillus silvisoli]|uniref:terminase small subunit n=1 Tax=Paenibacillus silvisoli TaxID=3110539 RepID=UPI002805AD1F|nr:terminase small subunit [Paenibacillus silvisoli]